MSQAVLDLVMKQPGRATRAIVDLDAIAGNVKAVSAHVGLDRPLRAVVKADGYGHGAVMVARTAIGAGATCLAVATIGELAALRRAGLSAGVLVLGPIDTSEIDRAISLDAELTLADANFARAVSHRAESGGVQVPVHVKVDTGMHRFGVAPADFVALIAVIDSLPGLALAGVETHHAMSDDPDSPVAIAQVERFADLVASAGLDNREDVTIHHANSGAALTRLGPVRGPVRLGIAMYGLQPGPDEALLPGMRSSMSVVSRLTRVHHLAAGDGVSYGHTYVASGPERVGLVPIGYGDGYRRANSNMTWMSVNGKRGRVRGRVCMDQTVIGGLDSDVRLDDIVGVAGPIGNGPSFDDLAAVANTINYETVTAISPRVPRYYIRDGAVLATLVEGVLESA